MPDKLNDNDFQEAATLLNCDVLAIKAVAEVEKRRRRLPQRWARENPVPGTQILSVHEGRVRPVSSDDLLSEMDQSLKRPNMAHAYDTKLAAAFAKYSKPFGYSLTTGFLTSPPR